MMERLLYIVIGYAFGCIQNAIIIGKIIKKIDVRKHGSGNAGATNVVRVVGRRAGVAVLVLDMLKAVAAFLLTAFIFGDGEIFGSLIGLYAGLGAVLGHVFPFFMRFKGGKGMACSVGIMLVLDWRAALIVFAIGILIVFVSRYVSLASILVSSLYLIALLFFGIEPEGAGVYAFIAAIVIFMHRQNIIRLLKGVENKFGLKA